MAGQLASHAAVTALVAKVDDLLNNSRAVDRETLMDLRDFARDHLAAPGCPLERDPVPHPGPDQADPLDDTLDDDSPRARTRRSPRGGDPLRNGAGDDGSGFTEPPTKPRTGAV